jgi:hypothetical protein
MATETILSPGVLLQETDKSFITPGVDPSGMAIIGPTTRGPVEVPTRITNYNEFKEIFGTSLRNGNKKEEYFTHLAVKNYFRNGGSSALVVRVVSGSFTAAANTHITSSKGGDPGTLTSTISTGSTSTGTFTNGNYTNISLAGGSGNGGKVAMIVDSDGNITSITLSEGSFYEIGDELTFAGSSVGGSGTITLDLLTTSNLINNQPFSLETLGKGKSLNQSTSISIYPPSHSNGVYVSGSTDNIKWEIKDINNANGTFTLVIRRGDDKPKAPTVLESFPEVSLDPLSPNYIAKAVGDQKQEATLDGETGDYLITTTGEFANRSKYVRVASVEYPTYKYLNNNGAVGEDNDGVSYSGSLPLPQSGGFYGAAGDLLSDTPENNRFGSASGTTVSDIQGLDTGSYDIAISLLKNKDEFKFKTLIVPGLNQDTHPTTIDTIIENTTQRGDSFFITDLEVWGATVAQVTDEASDIDSSFSAAYWPWVQVFSTELARNVWSPASTIIPGVYSKNDSLGAPWFAPAGEVRGRVGSLVAGVEKKLSKANRDTLYANKVNPVASFSDSGILIFGQKTLQNAKSALDRVNVRRMLLDVKDTIGGFADEILFDQNTDTVRSQFTKKASKYLDDLVQRNGLYAYKVKMDGQLNTPDVIDENKLVGQVFLQPTKTAEFIVIDFVVTRTGASFTD